MISRTSIYVAAGRALGAREPDPSARNPDYLAEKLLGDPSQLQLDHPSVRALSHSCDEAMTDVGLELRELLPVCGPESVDRYLTRAHGTRVGEEAIAAITARMMERARSAAPSTPQAPQMSPDQIRAQQRLMSYQLAEAVVSSSGSS